MSVRTDCYRNPNTYQMKSSAHMYDQLSHDTRCEGHTYHTRSDYFSNDLRSGPEYGFDRYRYMNSHMSRQNSYVSNGQNLLCG